MTKQNHSHKLKKHSFKSGNAFFFCTLPDCNFKINPALSLGKRTICWRCGKEFLMTEYSLRLVKPHCEACHKTKIIKDADEGNLIMNETPVMSTNDQIAEQSVSVLENPSLSERINKLFAKDEEI